MAVQSGFPILSTRDLRRLEAFYSAAFGGVRSYAFDHEGQAVYVSLTLGGASLGIALDRQLPDGVARVALWLYVDDVDDAYRRALDAGASSVAEPVAEIAGEGRLARAAALYGVAGAAPNIIALGGGVWAAEAWGFPAVFAIAGTVSLAGAALAWLLPAGSHGSVGRPTRHELLRIAPTIVLFAASTAAFGAASTFLPVAGPAPATAALALLAAACGIVLGRFVAGWLAEHFGTGRLLLPGAAGVAAGTLLIGLTLDSADGALLLGAALVGTGFGVCQNDSFVLTLDWFGATRRGTASTIWNIAYDGGVGLGALGLGWVIGSLGHAGAFLALAAAIAAIAMASIVVQHRAGRPGHG